MVTGLEGRGCKYIGDKFCMHKISFQQDCRITKKWPIFYRKMWKPFQGISSEVRNVAETGITMRFHEEPGRKEDVKCWAQVLMGPGMPWMAIALPSLPEIMILASWWLVSMPILMQQAFLQAPLKQRLELQNAPEKHRKTMATQDESQRYQNRFNMIR